MASDYDQNDSSDLILGSAIKCYNSAVQQELYAFFSGNAAWDQTVAGQSVQQADIPTIPVPHDFV